jgi:hypothetical protein
VLRLICGICARDAAHVLVLNTRYRQRLIERNELRLLDLGATGLGRRSQPNKEEPPLTDVTHKRVYDLHTLD